MSWTSVSRSLPPAGRTSLLVFLALAAAAAVFVGQRTRSEARTQTRKAAQMKAHETSLTASQEMHAGSRSSLRCAVSSVKSIAETTPIAGAKVSVALRSKEGKTHDLAEATTGKDGSAEIGFTLPELEAGQYTLAVRTSSSRGSEVVERPVKIKSEAKVLLVTDKPLYQPGQVIHIRALSLRSFDLKPVTGKDLIFEVEDSKGNKVFKRTFKTSDYGVASVDFQLADEVNMGEYRVRAILGEHQADKTVTVKRYVLPKFKTELTADKRFYLPKETIHADLQTDYFFGKPVAGGKIKVVASTFDVQFRQFQTWEGKTDANGHARFEIKLPGYFVGQPLQKGSALVRLEATVTDTADHSETISKSYTVSDQPIRVSLIPESGRLLPGVENRVFAAAIYPDGSPAPCTASFWLGRQAKGKPVATVQTNASGLAEFVFVPRKEHFRQGEWSQRTVEMLGGQSPTVWGPKMLCDLFAQARDNKGNTAQAVAEITSEPLGQNVLLRLDKAIYRSGDTMALDIRTSAGLPTVYVDVVKSGQTILTRWLDVKDARAAYRLELPAEMFGTLEVHAYQMLSSGEIIRDSRVVYVNPREELRVEVQPDKAEYLPGQTGQLRFQVTDSSGKPTAAAIGVIIVDEAVYALQEMQPGLEKVYFTLQEELLKPKGQVVFRPQESIQELVKIDDLPTGKQQIAQALLASVTPPPPARLQVEPAFERRQKFEGNIQQIGGALLNYATNSGQTVFERDRESREWRFKADLLKTMIKAGYLDRNSLLDPFGVEWTLEEIGRIKKEFSVENLARAVTHNHMQQIVWMFINYTSTQQSRWFKGGKWQFPGNVLADSLRRSGGMDRWLKDAWGGPIRLLERKKKLEHQTGWSQLDYHELASAGPDGKFETADDVTLGSMAQWQFAAWWWLNEDERTSFQAGNTREALLLGGVARGGGRGFGGGFGAPGMVADGLMAPAGRAMPMAMMAKGGALEMATSAPAGPQSKSGSAAPARVREFFPETMFWQPALITDEDGKAQLPLQFADSITTWRLSASASARNGLLGGVTAPLRVFQDFFVDLDMPVSLTQNDEVAFPVAVYNYLKTPQTVRIELKRDGWFDLLDSEGFVRNLDIKPNEVTVVKFRIRAKRIGFQPLTVTAAGSKMSDAIKRTIEVVPDGSRVEKVITDRLSGQAAQVIEIPGHAIPDASKILVKIYPGVFSQVMEGMEGMLRMPFG